MCLLLIDNFDINELRVALPMKRKEYIKMKKILMTSTCCFLLLLCMGSVKPVEAKIDPLAIDGKTEYYEGASLQGNCLGHLTAYVEITFFQNTTSGSYMKVSRIRTKFDSQCGAQKVKITSTAPVGTRVSHGSSVNVTQYFKCPKHGNRSVTARVGGW